MCGALKLSGIVRTNVRLNIAIPMLFGWSERKTPLGFDGTRANTSLFKKVFHENFMVLSSVTVATMNSILFARKLDIGLKMRSDLTAFYHD